MYVIQNDVLGYFDVDQNGNVVWVSDPANAYRFAHPATAEYNARTYIQVPYTVVKVPVR